MYRNYLLPTLLLIGFSSCTTQMYVSNVVNTPLFKEKGEAQITVTQNDLQAAVAVSDKLAIMANGFYEKFDDVNGYKHGGMLGEAAIGYYKTLNPAVTFETFAGFGLGNIYKQQQFSDENFQEYLGTFNANAAKVFVQPDFGYRSKYFDACISSRFSFVKYSRFDSKNYPENYLKDDYLDGTNLTGPLFLFSEPAITIRAGYKFIKVQAQYGLTVNLSGNDIRHKSSFSSLGLVINIAKWYNNSATEK